MAITVIDSGEQAYLRDLARIASSDRGSHRLEIQNNMDYARDLHERQGYYVFNDTHMLGVVDDWLEELVESNAPLKIGLALEGAGFEEVNFLRSYTGEFKAGVRDNQGSREKHPGGWADITTNLMGAYRHKVNDNPLHPDSDYDITAED